MKRVVIAATLLSLALVGSASAQQVVATDPDRLRGYHDAILEAFGTRHG